MKTNEDGTRYFCDGCCEYHGKLELCPVSSPKTQEWVSLHIAEYNKQHVFAAEGQDHVEWEKTPPPVIPIIFANRSPER